MLVHFGKAFNFLHECNFFICMTKCVLCVTRNKTISITFLMFNWNCCSVACLMPCCFFLSLNLIEGKHVVLNNLLFTKILWQIRTLARRTHDFSLLHYSPYAILNACHYKDRVHSIKVQNQFISMHQRVYLCATIVSQKRRTFRSYLKMTKNVRVSGNVPTS